jgi:YNFM family putative membrane transporter
MKKPDERSFFWLYVCIFCLFFVFAAMMNFLPFELKRLNPETGETGVGFLYLGYSMGLIVSLNVRKIIQNSGSIERGIGSGIVVFFVGCLLFAMNSYAVMFFAMFIFCAGLFTAHSLLSGFVNTLAEENKAIANGLYISFYYTGGTLGSVLPGAVYERWGWHSFLVFLLLMLSAAFFFLIQLSRATRK